MIDFPEGAHWHAYNKGFDEDSSLVFRLGEHAEDSAGIIRVRNEEYAALSIRTGELLMAGTKSESIAAAESEATESKIAK